MADGDGRWENSVRGAGTKGPFCCLLLKTGTRAERRDPSPQAASRKAPLPLSSPSPPSPSPPSASLFPFPSPYLCSPFLYFPHLHGMHGRAAPCPQSAT